MDPTLPEQTAHKAVAAVIGGALGSIVAKYALGSFVSPDVIAQVSDSAATWGQTLFVEAFSVGFPAIFGGIAAWFTRNKVKV